MMNLIGMQNYLNDIIALSISAITLAAYHFYLKWHVGRDPSYSVQALHAVARTAWVENVMKNGRDILAVQTLRNSTMAATFLASTAILLIVGVLSLSGQGDKLGITWHALSSVSETDPPLWMVKLLFLIVDLSFAFFSFTQAVRKFHHVGYLVNVPKEFNHPVLTPRYVAAYLNRAGKYYSLGMRAYYFLLPLVFWLFGPNLMVGATLVLVFVLYHLDRAADETGTPLPAAEVGPQRGTTVTGIGGLADNRSLRSARAVRPVQLEGLG